MSMNKNMERLNFKMAKQFHWQFKFAFLRISCYTLTWKKFCFRFEIAWGWDK